MPVVEPYYEPLKGLHHVTAIASNPNTTFAFYTGVLGLRLVKLTVNQDDPTQYHLFFGDAVGTPGTTISFFIWPNGKPGQAGAGKAKAVAFAIPSRSLTYWKKHLTANGYEPKTIQTRLGEKVLEVRDPDGLTLELVAGRRTGQRTAWTYWEESSVPREYAIRGLHGITLMEKEPEPTVSFLRNVLTFQQVHQEQTYTRFFTGEERTGAYADVYVQPDASRGSYRPGVIHHVAWATSDETTQRYWQQEVARAGIHVSPIIDRHWFKSIYFHEPGGILFEIATERPGFTRDESVETLGQKLVLPPWLEPQREVIQKQLPPFTPSLSTANKA